LKLISFGSGNCSAEIELANYGVFEEIVCVDIAMNQLNEAREIAKSHNLNCMKFLCQDANSVDISSNYYDIVFFQASLHHLNNIKSFTENSIMRVLKDKGLLVISEYVGPTRLQFPKTQIKKINEGLNLIPKKYKTRYLSNLSKKKYYGSGILRMILADPSECIDSESILPSIYSHFEKLIEKPFGGNILMTVLKDISHHFLELNDEKSQILSELFDFEDNYLKTHSSDFIFGVYQKK
jgi:ubiquinone/menaquinone biosynthesis C-methylase UbiE